MTSMKTYYPGIAVLALGYLMSQFYRSFLAVLTPVLGTDLGVTSADLSLASGAWFIAFALMQFPIGIWLDRYGPRRMTACLFLIGAGGALLFSIAQTVWHLTLAMTLIGIGCAPVLMASFFIFAKVFSPARFALLSAWLIAFGTAGNVAGAAPLATLANYFGWRPVMLGLAVVTGVLGLGIFWLVRDPDAQQADHKKGMASLIAGYGAILRLPGLLWLVPLIFVAYAVPAGFRGLWAGPYLNTVFGFDSLAIGSTTLWMAIAMVFGCLIYGPLDNWLGTRKWVNVGGNMLVLFAVLVLALFPAESAITATLMLCLIGLAGMSYPVLVAHAKDFFPAELTGRGVTLMNFFSIGGVGALQWMTGAILGKDGFEADPVNTTTLLFGFYAACLGLALLIYLKSTEICVSE